MKWQQFGNKKHKQIFLSVMHTCMSCTYITLFSFATVYEKQPLANNSVQTNTGSTVYHAVIQNKNKQK